jgi:hypothetical protein
MPKIKIFLCVALLFLLIICGCNHKSYSIGDFESIIVFSDSILFEKMQPVLEKTFNQYIYTPHSEKSFFLNLVSIQHLNQLKRRRNLLFLGLLGGEDTASKYIQKMLSPELKKALENGEIFYIFKEDLFAINQMSIILTAADTVQLYQKIDQYHQDIYEILEEYNLRRLSTLLYVDGRQENLEHYLADLYGFKFDIPLDYYLIKETPDSNFIWLKRLRPDRNLVVYRFKGTDFPTDEKKLFDLRDSLSYEHFQGDRVNREDSYLKRVPFNAQEAVKLVGLWENLDPKAGGPIGGPFRSYVFADKKNKWIYFIDISVTAPGQWKKPFLDQLEVLAASFQLVSKEQSLPK